MLDQRIEPQCLQLHYASGVYQFAKRKNIFRIKKPSNRHPGSRPELDHITGQNNPASLDNGTAHTVKTVQSKI
jgi:hypothetical protein